MFNPIFHFGSMQSLIKVRTIIIWIKYNLFNWNSYLKSKMGPTLKSTWEVRWDDMKKQQKEYENDCLFQLKNEKSGQESEVESELFIKANNKTSYKAIK